MGTLLIYAGLLLLLAGLLSLVRPLRFLRIRNRREAAAVFAGGLILAIGGAALPAPLERASGPRTLLDDFVPAYQFHESHSARIRASRDAVDRAMRMVTAKEIRFFRTLTWIRSPRLSRSRETILAPSADRPILDVALGSGFLLLAHEPGRELVFGTILGLPFTADRPRAAGFGAFDRPGFCKVAMNFLLREQGDGEILLTTETRIFATDSPARRRFAVYWRVISPGSALIRRSWLAAIKRRAENPAP